MTTEGSNTFEMTVRPHSPVATVTREMILRLNGRCQRASVLLTDTTPYAASDEPPGRLPLQIGYDAGDRFVINTFRSVVERWIDVFGGGMYRITLTFEPISTEDAA